MFRRLIAYHFDREFYSELLQLALPVALQSLITSSLSLVGVVMIGQLGDAAVAAVGLANQIFFLLNLVLFGIASGCAIFTAQLWGKRDIYTIRKVVGLTLSLCLATGFLFLLVAVLIPGPALGLYSIDPEVIELGSQYLRVYGWGFIFFAVSLTYSIVLRSTGDVRTPLWVSTAALALNTLLSYGLIFGKLGMPRLEVQGAALAALIARFLECVAIVWIPSSRKAPVAVSLREVLRIDLSFASRVLKPVLPVILNETLWALGITTYYAVYARIGTDSVAAINIAASIDNVALVAFLGIAQACAILVGNRIGVGELNEAHHYGVRSLFLGAAGALVVGGIILVISPTLLAFYKVSPIVTQHAQRILTIIGLTIWVRAMNVVLFLGILRSGGDTHYAFVLEVGIIWGVGVPLAVVGAFLFGLPVHLVYLLVLTEEFSKWILGLFRFNSRKWIHNLAETVAGF